MSRTAGRRVAIVGATGAVGEELLLVLAARAFPVSQLSLLASERSAGQQLRFRGELVPVQALADDSFRGVELALFSAGAAVARQWAPRAVAAGAVVVDNSSAFRQQDDVPLVVPEVNAAALRGHRGLIANPNCSTIILVLALAPLHAAAGLAAVVVATYQAASGAGRQALLELRRGAAAALAGEPFTPAALPHALGFNLFPRVDVFGPDGYTREEDKLQHESRKILGVEALAVEATCVRVPVERCHSEAVAVALQRPLLPAAARALFARSPGLVVQDDPEHSIYPQPLLQAGRDAVAVGRIRHSRVFDPGLAFWLVGDQLRKGAALNAVQIAELV
ncbi:MAG TPA: aspartate-semialdehyde dehydrogenase [Planctomycetota bacterium]|nr:aspartate-semialdehyde dehydrogenase [Planctomycetota bacterium]